MNFNRRQFLRSAAGLLVASTALAVPERKVWALDSTMIPAEGPTFPLPPGEYDPKGEFDAALREAVMRNRLLLEQAVLYPDEGLRIRYIDDWVKALGPYDFPIYDASGVESADWV